MSTVTLPTAPHRAVRRRHPVAQVLLAPVSAAAWLATIHLLLGFWLSLASFIVIITLLSLVIGLAPTVIGGVAAAVLLIWSVRAFTAVQRSRFADLLYVRILPVPRRTEDTWLRRQWGYLAAASTWRQVVYHLLALVINTVGLTVVTTGWSVGIGWLLVPAYRWALPERGVLGIRMLDWRIELAAMAIGLVLLLLTPWLARGLAGVDAAAARALLGPSRAEALSQRVESLSRSRAGAVDAADAERRRIERDLHDGTQQRLVSLAMNLGMARAALGSDTPEPTRQAIEQAHEQAKQTLAELRDFVRGLHPAVLNDRGLDAALSGLAARSPVPVGVRVDLPSRCSPTIEAIAYFVVSEALANVARHANATRAEVTVSRVGGRLRVVVGDDGAGGARVGAGPGDGTGLRGLAQRAAAVDGTLAVDSPAGGPTLIVVELPCES